LLRSQNAVLGKVKSPQLNWLAADFDNIRERVRFTIVPRFVYKLNSDGEGF
jgi:hypothetical protein